jgi:hypothetical protein
MHHFPANATPNVTPISLPPPISRSHSGIFTPRPTDDHNADGVNANAVNDHGRSQSPYFPAAHNTNTVNDHGRPQSPHFPAAHITNTVNNHDNRQFPYFSGAHGINTTQQSPHSSASIQPVPLSQSQRIQHAGSRLQPFGGVYAPQPSHSLYTPFPSGSGVPNTRHQLAAPPATIQTQVPLDPQVPPTPGGSPPPLAPQRVSLPSPPPLSPSNSQLERANDDQPNSNSNDFQIIESSSATSSLGASVRSNDFQVIKSSSSTSSLGASVRLPIQ